MIARWDGRSGRATSVSSGRTHSPAARRVWGRGPRAFLDGASAVIASGLERYDTERIRVSVPRGARVRRTPLYDVRQTRRWQAEDRAGAGIPRARPAVAAARGALWARTDREAAYLLSTTVQQGLVRPEELGVELLRVRRRRRRIALSEIVNDLLDGARALGEIEFGKGCRRRGLTPPDRQVLRRDGRGRYSLDVCWTAHELVVEIDGIHHTWANNVIGDSLRQNDLTLHHDTVLRLPLLALRLQPDSFFAQIREALHASSPT